ncbi:MAG: M13 family metallopeptidase [Bacteroidia bacterium]|nr:M13 family metallopeptidase [Bacteroidia bacterium]
MKASYFTMCALSAAALVSACNEKNTKVAHFSENIDTTVKMSDNFYEYANGLWMKNHPLPEDRPRLGSFDLLHETSRERIREIIEEAAKTKGETGSASQKIGDLYALGMDTITRDELGVKPILPLLEMVDEISDESSLAKTIAKLNISGVYPFFAFYISPDPGNSTINIVGLTQNGLGLPDRDYYLVKSDRNVSLMEGYKTMLANNFKLAGIDNGETRANNVVELENALAEVMNSRVENRNPQARYNKCDYEGMKKMAPNFDWDSFIAEIGTNVNDINVNQVKYFANVGNIIKNFSNDAVKDYLKACVIRNFAPYLSTDFIDNNFEFNGKQLAGTPANTPLWKRMVGTVEGIMGEQLGQLYVEKYFPPTAKKRISDLIEQLRISFAQRIDSLSWMGEETKAQAKDKLNAITVKVGYPDKWKDYSELTIDPAKSFVENLIEATKWEYKKELDKYGKEVDRTEWHMTPQTVNAYYNPQSNEIVFPAGILQPPFFYAEGDDAVNYGGIGVVIGHEMTHGFDDQGCQFDKEGNLNNWWTAEDAERFATITSKLVDHFETLTVVDTVKCNGRLTLGENIADNGGLNIAYQALRNAVGDNDPMVDGQTIDERFILGYAQIWASNCRKEYLYNQATTDPHSATHLRVNGQMMLFDLFYNTFNIPEGSPMYKAPEERIVVW